MKSIILTLAISLLLGGFLFAQEWGLEHRDTFGRNVVIDSLLAVDRLSGSIYYQHDYYTVDSNWQEGQTWIGDYYDMGWMFWFASIGYLSFQLPAIPEGYHLQSAILMMYVGVMRGDTISGVYPVFTSGSASSSPDGILEHIDYGNTFNSDDIDPISVYNSYIYFTQETLFPPCWVIYDVSECVGFDIEMGRTLSQYRIYLEGFSDWDNGNDYISTSTGSSTYYEYATKLVYTLSDGTSVQESVLPIQNLSVSCYPNPFTEQSTITVKTPVPGKPELCVYNLKGQRVRDLECSSEEGKEYGYRWDGRDNAGKAVSAGVYLLVAKSGNNVSISKMLYVK